MGVVYRAAHVDTGAVVALKTVEVPSAGHLGGIRREIRALARLCHPGVVRIVADGVISGLPWYAMELYEGRTLRAHVKSFFAIDAPPDVLASAGDTTLQMPGRAPAPTAQDPVAAAGDARRVRAAGGRLDEALALVHGLCAPLAYLHGEGIVHHDLKPENVLVRADGVPVIMDFGLVTRFATGESRAVLEPSGDVTGTAWYMAPEQARGDAVDARADIYALGCILYELLTGRPPFLGDQAYQVLWKHMNRAPQRPSELATSVPRALEDLVMTLIAKDPRHRLGSAEDVARKLEAMGVEAGPATPRPRPYLYRPRLHGRDVFLADVKQRLLVARRAASTVILIEGESGIGKTSVASELAGIAKSAGFLVVTSECHRSTGAGPLAPFREVLQSIVDLCREHGEVERERLLGDRAPVLASLEPELRAIVSGARPAPLPPDAARERLSRYLTETLAALAEEQPVLLVIDDLQDADESTTSFLRDFAAHRSARAVAVVATYRAEDPGELLALLASTPQVVRLTLDRLDGAATEEIVADMLGISRAPGELARFVWRQSGGNPFFAAEHLHAALARGIVTRDAHGSWILADLGASDLHALEASTPLPGTLHELVSRRLDDLPLHSRRVLGSAAVLGSGVPEAILLATSGLPEAPFADALADLELRRVLHGSRDAISFLQETVRRVSYERIAPEERRELHAAAARSWEDRSDISSPGAIAVHWDRSGDPGRARPLYRRAGDLAMERFQYREARRMLSRCLEITDPGDPDRPRLGIVLAEALSSLGDMEGARAQHEANLCWAQAEGQRLVEGQVLVSLGYVYFVLGRDGSVGHCFERALEIFQQVSDRSFEARILGNMAILERKRGRSREARELDLRALAILKDHPHEAAECGILGNLANICTDLGDVEEARSIYERTLAMGRRLDLPEAVGMSSINLGELLCLSGEHAAAEALALEAIATFARTGYRRMEATAHWLLGLVHEQQGRRADAIASFELTLAIVTQIGDPDLEATALLALGRVATDDGRLDDARPLAARALELYERAGDRRQGAEAAALAARIARLAGDPASALATLLPASAASQAAGYARPRALCLVEEAHLALAGGRGCVAQLAELRAIVARVREEAGPLGAALQCLASLAGVSRCDPSDPASSPRTPPR